MKVALVSGSEDKARELRGLFPGWTIELLDARGAPEEEGPTFYENAKGKARFGRTVAQPDAWVLADDSGLEVEGLGGLPGVRSARWAGGGEDPLAKLVEQLEGVTGEGRRARYVCELVCLSPEGEEFRGTGTLAGTIAEEPRGTGGFGYDPLFVPEGETRTVAELGDGWKAEHSHRARAARALRRAVGSSARGV